MYTIYNDNVFDILPRLDANSIDCIITSPPYWGLRNYNHSKQIGMEKSPIQYINTIVKVMQLCRRVLKKEGTLFLNIGDCYVGAKGKSGSESSDSQLKRICEKRTISKPQQTIGGKGLIRPHDNTQVLKKLHLKRKDLIGMPWRLAFALQKDGWYLRNDIIWAKSNPMPESVKDRFTKSHEYIFLLSKSAKYYFDYESTMENCLPGKKAQVWNDRKENGEPMRQGLSGAKGITFGNGQKRNKRTVWNVATRAEQSVQYATFPPELIIPCISAGCPVGGTVLDPFAGSGTTGGVAECLKRNSILVDINPDYCAFMPRRIANIISEFTPKAPRSPINQLELFQ